MLKLKRFDEPAWYDYEPGIRFLIKPLSRVDLLDIRLHCKRKILIQGAESPDQIADDFDRNAIIFESFKTALVSWEGLEIEGIKNPGREQLLKSLYQDEAVVDFVLIRAYRANEAEEKKLEEELKNSQSSQDGLSTSNGSK
jgi:hypothetical protein